MKVYKITTLGELKHINRIKTISIIKNELWITIMEARDYYDNLVENYWKLEFVENEIETLNLVFRDLEYKEMEDQVTMDLASAKYAMIENQERLDAENWYETLSDEEKNYVNKLISLRSLGAPIG